MAKTIQDVIGFGVRHLPLKTEDCGMLDDIQITSCDGTPIAVVENAAGLAADAAKGDGDNETTELLSAETHGFARLFIHSPDLLVKTADLLASLEGAMFEFVDRQEKVDAASAEVRAVIAAIKCKG